MCLISYIVWKWILQLLEFSLEERMKKFRVLTYINLDTTYIDSIKKTKKILIKTNQTKFL